MRAIRAILLWLLIALIPTVGCAFPILVLWEHGPIGPSFLGAIIWAIPIFVGGLIWQFGKYRRSRR